LGRSAKKQNKTKQKQKQKQKQKKQKTTKAALLYFFRLLFFALSLN